MSRLVSFVNTSREKGNIKDEERREEGGSPRKHYITHSFFLLCQDIKKFFVILVNRLLRNTIHQLVRYFWVFVNSESIFYFMESFFLKKTVSFGLLVSCSSLS